MRGFRSKLIFCLIVYFAGFATAIYFIAPVPEGDAAARPSGQSFAWSDLHSDEFAARMNVHLHRWVDFIKEKSCEAGEYIKEKMEERKNS